MCAPAADARWSLGGRYPFLIYWFLDWWWGSFLIGGFGVFSYYISWELAGVCFLTSVHFCLQLI